MDSARRSLLFVTLSALLWGTYGSFVTVISALGMTGNILVFLRLLVTCVCTFLLIRRTDPDKLRVRPGDLWLFALNGFGSILFFTVCYTAAIRQTSIAQAAALLYTAPAIVLILSACVFGEKITGRKVVCILVSVLGCALVSGIGGESSRMSAQGLLLGLGAGLGYALYSIFSRMITNRGYTALTNVLYTFGFGTAGYAVLCLAEGSFAQVAVFPAAALLSVLCGIVTGFAAYVLYTTGLEGMEPSRAAQLATIEPVFAAVLGTFLFRQPMELPALCGIACIVGACIAMSGGERKTQRKPET